MPEPQNHSGEGQRLVACLREVSVARARLQAARNGVNRGGEEQILRTELLVALEGYVAAITMLGAPVAGKLKAEVELYHRLKNHR